MDILQPKVQNLFGTYSFSKPLGQTNKAAHESPSSEVKQVTTPLKLNLRSKSSSKSGSESEIEINSSELAVDTPFHHECSHMATSSESSNFSEDSCFSSVKNSSVSMTSS